MGSAALRRLDIDRAKGIAILFVVFGHLVARADPSDVVWYEPLRRAVYAFHMPFFLYLSGLVAALSGAAFLPPGKWGPLVRVRARRLLVPVLLMGVLTVLGKTVASRFVFVDFRPGSIVSGLEELLWHTAASPAISIWYLFVLFVLSIVTPLLIFMDRGRLRYIFLISLLLYCVPLPAYVYLDHVSKYAVFFVVGLWAGGRRGDWDDLVDRYWRECLLLLLCGLVSVAIFGRNWPERLELFPLGIISMPALHGLVRHLGSISAQTFLWLGQNSFMIYLLNTICIGLAKGILLRVTDWNGAHFLPFAAVLMCSGCLGPIMLKQAVVQWVSPVSRRIA
jgi:fucose 4-O-acetylase-like acetyltransferase